MNDDYTYQISNHILLNQNALFNYMNKTIFYNDLSKYCKGCRFDSSYFTCYRTKNIKGLINFNLDYNYLIIRSLMRDYKFRYVLNKRDVIDLNNMITLFICTHELEHVLQYKSFYENDNSDNTKLIINATIDIFRKNNKIYAKYEYYNLLEYNASINAYLVVLKYYKDNDITISDKVLAAFNYFVANALISSYKNMNNEISYPKYSLHDIAHEYNIKLNSEIEEAINLQVADNNPKSFINGNKIENHRIEILIDISKCKKMTKNIVHTLYK